MRIRRQFTTLSSGQQSDETVLGITSLTPIDDVEQNAQRMLDVARGQWTIENSNHYVRDRTYDEDRCPVRHPNSAQILATLRSLARFMAKKEFHKPRTAHQKTTPAFIRFCQYHRATALHWLND